MNHGLTHNKPSHFDSDAMTSVEQPRHQKVSVLRGLVPFSSPPSSVNIISIAFTKLLKHNNSNQQPTPPHQSTCLPTSDPAAPTRLVTSAPSATPRSRPSRTPTASTRARRTLTRPTTPVRSCAMHTLQCWEQDADIGHRGRAYHCQPTRA
jgi:hypothetical protein